jgi:hypothetical protein
MDFTLQLARTQEFNTQTRLWIPNNTRRQFIVAPTVSGISAMTQPLGGASVGQTNIRGQTLLPSDLMSTMPLQDDFLIYNTRNLGSSCFTTGPLACSKPVSDVSTALSCVCRNPETDRSSTQTAACPSSTSHVYSSAILLLPTAGI